jgi:hypothetical protein
MIDLLEVNSALMATFFEDLHRFKAKAKEAAKALTPPESSSSSTSAAAPVDLNQQMLVGKQVYIVQIKVRPTLWNVRYLRGHIPY